MIFILDEFGSVDVYESIDMVVNYIEWQDIFEGKQLIFDENGNTYEWDSNQKDEIGTIYGYTMIISDKQSNFIQDAILKYKALGRPDSFKIKID